MSAKKEVSGVEASFFLQFMRIGGTRAILRRGAVRAI